MADSWWENHDTTMLMHRKHDSSKAKCLWHGCTKRIDPNELFCSRGCRNKASNFSGGTVEHRKAYAESMPDRAWFEYARYVDGDLWSGMSDEKRKLFKHKQRWDSRYGYLFKKKPGSI